MWLDDLIAPSGSHPASVYWFRRVVLLVGVIIFFWIILSLGGGGGDKTSTGSTTNHPSSSPSPTHTTSTSSAGSGSTGGLAACNQSDLAFSADAAKTDYASNEYPKITISIKNNGSASCKFDTDQRYLTIMSGNDLWFSSKACQTAPNPTINIGSQQTVEQSYTWGRKRQATDCSVGGSAVPGTYLAQAHLGDKASPGEVIVLH